MQRLLPWGALLALAVYYAYFASVALRAGLSHDDLMNMHSAVTAPWPALLKESVFFFLPSDQYRPVGSIYYRVIRDLWGAQPFALHLALAALWALAMAAMFDAARQLLKSSEAALIAVLLMVHHSNRPFYYYNSGFCYDILCYLFFFATLSYYLRARQRGAMGEREILVLTGLFALALGSKEMAVSLPVVLAAYEWGRPGSRDWRFTLLSGVMTALFLGGRVFGPNGLSGVGSYVPRPSVAAYRESWNDWLTHLTFLAPLDLATGWILLFFALVLGGAWISGDHGLRVGAVLLLVGVLPVAFIRPMRGLEQVVIPMTGLAWMLAWWLTRLTWIVPLQSRAALVFALLLLTLWNWHSRRMPTEEAMMREGREIGHIWNEFRRATPGLRPNSRVLVRRDPFAEPFIWATVFMGHIDHGPGLQVVREESQTTPQNPADFDYVLAWESNRFVTLKPLIAPQ